jgi:hypothetical protein
MWMLLLLILMYPVNDQDEIVLHPDVVHTCLEQPQVKPVVEVTYHSNPYYLRGDFDGDGKPDYAVAIKGPRTQRNGVLICTAVGPAHILGADNPKNPPFSDMPDDNFAAPHWMVNTKEETAELGKYEIGVPREIPTPKGETIAMIWEDGIALIYWDGTRFRWAG